jgi:6-pyruvoyl-tetrahydropterin synthase
VRDFAEVSAVWFSVFDRLDHQNLNERLPEKFLPSTAENIAAYIAAELSVLPELVAVRLWETEHSWARVQVEP